MAILYWLCAPSERMLLGLDRFREAIDHEHCPPSSMQPCSGSPLLCDEFPHGSNGDLT
jgi:hypothetical protein